MLSFKVIAALALPLLAAANPLAARTGPCNTGTFHCCESTSAMSGGGSLLGVLGGLLTGTGCSSTNILLNPSSCNQQAVCCEGNSFNGLVAFGCTPINVNL